MHCGNDWYGADMHLMTPAHRRRHSKKLEASYTNFILNCRRIAKTVDQGILDILTQLRFVDANVTRPVPAQVPLNEHPTCPPGDRTSGRQQCN